MSRIRTVKPELFRHEALFDAELDSGLPLRLAFVGLFTVADCEGRFPWKPRTLKLDVLPHDTVDFSAVLTALERAGFIQSYEANGTRYGLIPGFAKHQHINIKEKEKGSDYPPPPEISPSEVPVPSQNHPSTIPEPSQNHPSTLPERQEVEVEVEVEVEEEEEGKGKGEEREDARARKRPPAPISAHWQPSPPALDILRQQGIPADFAQACLPEFRLYWAERGEKRPGWDASFVNSVKRSWEKRPMPRASPQSKAEQLHEHNQRAIAQWLAQDVPVIEGEVCHVAH